MWKLNNKKGQTIIKDMPRAWPSASLKSLWGLASSTRWDLGTKLAVKSLKGFAFEKRNLPFALCSFLSSLVLWTASWGFFHYCLPYPFPAISSDNPMTLSAFFGDLHNFTTSLTLSYLTPCSQIPSLLMLLPTSILAWTFSFGYFLYKLQTSLSQFSFIVYVLCITQVSM